MSVQAITWALEQTVGSPTGKVILICLANYADKNGENCFPGHETISAECEVSRRSVVDWMARLEEAGLIVRKRRNRPDGSRSSDSVVLLMKGTKTTKYSGQGAETAHSEAKVQMVQSQGANDSISKVQHVHTKNRQVNRQGTDTPKPPAGVVSADDDLLEEFDQCVWADFPRHPNSRKAEAFKCYRRLSKDDRVKCLRGVARYSLKFDQDTHDKRPRDIRLRYVPHLTTWINQRGWEAELETA